MIDARWFTEYAEPSLSPLALSRLVHFTQIQARSRLRNIRRERLQSVMCITENPYPLLTNRHHLNGRKRQRGPAQNFGDGHEKRFDPYRRDLACDPLARARRWHHGFEPR